MKLLGFITHRSRTMFRAVRHRNFKLFIEGQSLSLIGTWMQRIAVNWLTYKLTGSPLSLGVVNFTISIPYLFVAPFGGIMADKLSKHKVLLITQSLALVQAVLFAVLYFSGIINIIWILLLSLTLGIINAVDNPVRQSFVHEMVDDNKEDLANAIAMNSTMVNGARLIGPSLAGIIIAYAGEGWCFVGNALSFVAVVTSLLRMKITKEDTPKNITSQNAFKEIKDGAKYALSTQHIKYLLFFLAVVGIMSNAILILAPAFVSECLHGNAKSYGFLVGAWGVGALISAVYLLNRKSAIGLEKVICFAVLLLGISVIILSSSNVIWMAMIFMVTAGTGLLLEVASTNTLLQTVSEKKMRGRIMSFYSIAFLGMAPIGSILAGILGKELGIRLTFIVSGIICVIAAIFYSKKIHKITPHIKEVCKRESHSAYTQTP